MSAETKNPNEKKVEDTIDPKEEAFEATGQRILGEIEKIGGILTANPEAQAQGDYNLEVGRLRKEIAEELIETDSEEE